MKELIEKIKDYLINLMTDKIPVLEQVMVVFGGYRYADRIETACEIELDLEDKNDLMLQWCSKKLFVKIIQIVLFPCVYAVSWMFCENESLFLMSVYLFLGNKKVEDMLNDLLGIC